MNEYSISPQEDSLPVVGHVFRKGIVTKVFLGNETDIDSIRYLNKPTGGISNCIKFKDLEVTEGASLNTRPEYEAQPLLRGIIDSVKKEDTILYVDIDDTFYWLGPINTTNDPGDVPTKSTLESSSVTEELNYLAPSNGRVSTAFNYVLDNPYNMFQANINSPFLDNGKFNDLFIEGRHSNRIRLGARGIYPHIFIENNAQVNQRTTEEVEEIFFENQGSLIGILSGGSLNQHIINFDKLSYDTEVEIYNKTNPDFLATKIAEGNDKIDGKDRFNINYGQVPEVNDNNPDPNPDDFNEFDQIIMFSDRITFDASQNDLTFSAKRNINFGAYENFTLNTKGNTIINSNNIYLGRRPNVSQEPLVLGNELRKILIRIMEVLNKSRANVQGVALPLVDSNLKTLNLIPDDEIGTLLQELKDLDPENPSRVGFLSQHHYIEQNNRKINNEG